MALNKPKTEIHSAKELNFCHKLKFLISISLQCDGVNHLNFKLRLFDLKKFMV